MTALFSIYGSNNRLFDDNGLNGKSGLLFYGLSFCLHLGFAFVLMFVQNFNTPVPMPPAIRVDLVSFVPLPDNSGNPPAASEQGIDNKTIKKPDPELVKKGPDVSLAPKTNETVKAPAKVVPEKAYVKPPEESQAVSTEVSTKVSLKKNTYSPSKVLASARESIEKSVEKEKEDNLNKAFSRLEEKVRQTDSDKPTASGSSLGTTQGPSGTRGSSQAIDLYNLELMYRIQQNWAFNERLAGADKNLEVRILIKILKDGQLRDIWFETRSGNRYLDESALKAVKKSNPLPPLPKGYSAYDVGLIFTPSGLK